MTVQPYKQAVPVQANGQPVPVALYRPRGLSFAIHGIWKVGKSGFGCSGPLPVLLVDIEAAQPPPGRKIYWDPARQTVPRWDGSWDICVVMINDVGQIYALERILKSGQHDFNSISVDSVPMVAQRAMMAMAGTKKMERDDWGVLLRHIIGIVIGFKDLLVHPTKQVWAVTFIFPTHYDVKTRKMRPWLQGQAQDLMPYQADVIGYMYQDQQGRHMWIGPSDHYESGNRLWGALPLDMIIGHLGISDGWTAETMVERVIAVNQ